MSTTSSSLLLCALLLMTMTMTSYSHGHKCTHGQKEHPEPQFLDVEEDFPAPDEEGRRLGSTTYPNMRMVGYYDLLSSDSASYKTYFEKQLVPPVLAYFQAALKVKYPITSTLKVTVSSVCDVTTPAILKTGVTADYFIMFDSELDTKSSWVAESYSCFLATGSKRPLVAKTTVNRDLLKIAGSDVLLHEKNMYLLLHEMTHTLGFSSSLYKYFLDANGKTLTGHIKSATLDGSTSLVLDVAPLTTRLRNHFGCSTLIGAYMENSGSSATADSHFERRHFGFEALTSGLTYQQSYSEFTLALLEGSGWYVPDYSYADPHFFGQGQGCSFLTGTCSSSSFDDFCSTSSRGCTGQGRGGGTCDSDTRSDGCKFVHPYVDYDCDNANAANYARLPSLQAFGRSAYSKCFTGTLTSSSWASSSSFCFKFTCQGSGSTTTLSLNVGSQTITCKKAGAISVSGYNGSIDCPDPLTFCGTVGKPVCPRGCMGRGKCVSGKCVCNSGFTGKDCALYS